MISGCERDPPSVVNLEVTAGGGFSVRRGTGTGGVVNQRSHAEVLCRVAPRAARRRVPVGHPTFADFVS